MFWYLILPCFGNSYYHVLVRVCPGCWIQNLNSDFCSLNMERMCPRNWITNLNFDMLSPKLNYKSEFWHVVPKIEFKIWILTCCPQEAPRRYPEGTRGSIWEASGPLEASGSIWELLEASDLIFAVKLQEKCKSSIKMLILWCVLAVWFHICCKNGGKTLPGSVDGAPLLPRPLIQHRENPYR